MEGLTTADMGRMPVNEQERERLDTCFVCQVPTSSLDHFCPACLAAVCSDCVHSRLVNDPHCPSCGEAEENGRMIRIRAASWSAYSSAKSLWGGLLDLGSELLSSQDPPGITGGPVGLQPSAVLPVPDAGDSVESTTCSPVESSVGTPSPSKKSSEEEGQGSGCPGASALDNQARPAKPFFSGPIAEMTEDSSPVHPTRSSQGEKSQPDKKPESQVFEEQTFQL